MVPVDTFWPKMPKFGNLAQNLKNESWKKIPDLRNFEILGRFGSFHNFFKGCSSGFGSFQVLVGTLAYLLKQLMGELTFVRVIFSEVFYKQTVLKNFGNVLEKQVC